MRDNQKISFVKIAKILTVGYGTVRRAYDYARLDIVRKAAERGETPHRGQYSHLGIDTYSKIRELLHAGQKPGKIAAKLQCGASTVRRVQKQMQAEADVVHTL
jgi:hypothetical protein